VGVVARKLACKLSAVPASYHCPLFTPPTFVELLMASTPWIRVAACAVILLPLAATAAELKLEGEQPILVHADAAANDPDHNITRFSGHFTLSGTDWPIESDVALVYGPLEAPTRVLLEGKPARIWIKRNGIERDVAASADAIEYLREANKLVLTGGAVLVDGTRRTLTSTGFEYDLNRDRMSSSGPIKITAAPEHADAP